MAPRNKTVVISDVHISNGEKYAWFSRSNAEKLTGLLNAIRKDRDVEELVLLGDIFDLWLYPIHVKPWTIGKIIASYPLIAEVLQECVEKKKVYYMNGNHDMGVTAGDLKPYSVGSKTIEMIRPNDYNAKRNGKWHLEHGHEVDMFNAPDPSGDTIGDYPLGYFISRLTVSARIGVWDALKEELEKIHSELHKQIETKGLSFDLTESPLVSGIVDLLVLYSGVDPDAPIRFAEPALDMNYTVASIKQHYKNLYSSWYERYPDGRVLASMLSSRRLVGLEWYADELMRAAKPPELIVMGHTHKALPVRPYFNDGCFCGMDELSYVEIVDDTAELRLWP